MATSWAHSDTDSMPAGIMRALARAIPTTPTTDPQGFGPAVGGPVAARDLRALLAYSAIVTYAAATAGPPALPASDYAALPAGWKLLRGPAAPAVLDCSGPISFAGVDPSVVALARAVNNGWHALAVRCAKSRGDASLDLPMVYGFATENGKGPEALAGQLRPAAPEAGAPLVAMVAIVSGAAALMYLGAHALDAYERQLAREADSRRLVTLTAAASQVLGTHAQADNTAGKSTPLSAAEQQVLDALTSQIKAYQPTAPAPPQPAPPFDPNKAIGTASTSIVLPLVILAGLYFLKK